MSTQTTQTDRFRQNDPVEREPFPGPGDVLDPSRLESLAALEATGCEGLVQEVVALFLDTVPKSLKTLKDALVRGDLAVVERVAHSLKGSCGLLGARNMAESAASVERAAWPSAKEAAEGIRHLGEEWPRVQALLKGIQEKGTKSAHAVPRRGSVN